MGFHVDEDTVWLRRAVRWTTSVMLALASTWLLIYGFCTQVPVSDGSMQPVLDADDVVLVSRLIYDAGKSERFGIVVFERENHKKNTRRIIGLSGKAVQIRGGYIFTDGELLNTEDDLGQVSLAGRADTPIKLEDNEYFLLGDNRDSGGDSRFPDIRNVKREQVQDKVWFKIFPLLKLDFIHSR